MIFTVRAAMALLGTCLLPVVSAWADPPLPVLEKTGQLGTWATACDAPPSPQNVHVVYYAAGTESVRRRIDRGTGLPTLDGAVDSAKLVSPTTVHITLRNDDPNWKDRNGLVFETVVEVAAGRSRTMRSVGRDGTVFIADGKYANGNAVPTLSRCPEQS